MPCYRRGGMGQRHQEARRRSTRRRWEFGIRCASEVNSEPRLARGGDKKRDVPEEEGAERTESPTKARKPTVEPTNSDLLMHMKSMFEPNNNRLRRSEARLNQHEARMDVVGRGNQNLAESVDHLVLANAPENSFHQIL